MSTPVLFLFGPIRIPASQVFWEGSWTYALVNLRPVTPGHVLIVPKRVIPHFADLTPNELQELMQASARISTVLAGGKSTIAIQDGADAGQSVPHLHVHVVPFTGTALAPDECRRDRTREDMTEEAERYRVMMAHVD